MLCYFAATFFIKERKIMLLTEDEAKEKQCPVFEIAFNIGVEANREEVATCSGSRCIMWRWKPDGDKNTGFCGLAGTPDFVHSPEKGSDARYDGERKVES